MNEQPQEPCPPKALSRPAGSASEEIFNSEEYEKFVASMVSTCRCPFQNRPCDGVLSGGLCDGIQDDQYDDDEYDDE